jgi:CubicO group peptidase (beta-lactamase class C family)
MRLLPIARLTLATIALGVASGALAGDSRIAESIQPFVDRGALAGAVALVASPEKVLSVDAVGYSDVGSKVPMKPDALFWIASMNKPITATALMILVDEGKVKLDDPVEAYLPEFKGQMRVAERSGDLIVLKKPPRPITVRNLLSHTSGLVGRSPLEGKLDSLPIREGAITYGLSPLKFDPGSQYEYCNPGINTVGRIIEVVSGMPYEKFLQERLLDPLGMVDTTFWPDEAQLPRVAKSYKPGPEKAGLNGGQLDGKRYLSEAAVREMTSTQTGDLLNGGKGENGYGLGWSTSKKSKGEAGPAIPGPCGHGGAYATNMAIDPGKKLVTVWMVQHAGFPLDGKDAQGAFQRAAVEAFGK